MFHLIVFNLFAALIYLFINLFHAWNNIIITLMFTGYHGGFLKWLVSKETWDKDGKDDKLILFVYLTAKLFCMLALQ